MIKTDFKVNPPYKKSYIFKYGAAAAPKNPCVPRKVVSEGSGLSVQAGEDAYLVRHDALGVADGVGGWSAMKSNHSVPISRVQDADPALYSRRLLHHIGMEMEAYDDITNEEISSHDYYHLDPRKVVSKGYKALKEETKRDKILGSTTVLLCILRVFLFDF